MNASNNRCFDKALTTKALTKNINKKMFTRTIFTAIVFVVIRDSFQFEDEFHEELFLKPLPTDHINTYFQFSTEWALNRHDSRKINLSVFTIF